MLSVRGGARFGWANATMPLAELRASSEQLSIEAAILGRVAFAPAEVVALEPFVWVPVIAWGLRVRHAQRGAPATVRFWCLGSPRALHRRILATGFRPSAPQDAAVVSEGIPFRPWVLLVLFLVWNGTLLTDRALFRQSHGRAPGPLAASLFSALFVSALGFLFVDGVRRALLRPGREAGPVLPIVRLVALVLGILAVASWTTPR